MTNKRKPISRALVGDELQAEGAPPAAPGENRRLLQSLADSVHRLAETRLRAEDSRADKLTLVEELKDARRQLERAQRLLLHDPLTGLPSRALLFDRLHQVIAHCARRGRHCALLFLGLDGLEKINETLGYRNADSVLYLIGQRLKLCLRAGDTVGRLSGDEFLLLLPELQHRKDALQVARKVLAQSAAPYPIGGGGLAIACSIGVAIFPQDGLDAAGLMKSADAALHRAKGNGPNTYCSHDGRYPGAADGVSLPRPDVRTSRNPRITASFSAVARVLKNLASAIKLGSNARRERSGERTVQGST